MAIPHYSTMFTTGSKLHVVKDSPSQRPFVFLNSVSGLGMTVPFNTWNATDPQVLPLLKLDNQWVEFPIPHWMPPEADSIFFIGIILCTFPSNAVPLTYPYVNIFLAARRGGSTGNPGGHHQLTCKRGDGAREEMAFYCPVKDGKFALKLDSTLYGTPPSSIGFGMTLMINAFTTPEV
jgi:hypothetical protein